MGGALDWAGDAISDVFSDPIGSITNFSTQPFEWLISDPLQYLGNQSGIDWLSQAGRSLESVFDNPLVQYGATALGGYGLGSSLFGGGSLFGDGLISDPSLAGLNWGNGTADIILGGGGAAGGGMGGLLGGSLPAVLGLGGMNLLGQYYGAQAQAKSSEDAWNRQLAAQQAYQATQRADIQNAQNQVLSNWMQYGFPNQGAVQAGIDQGKNTIKQNTKTSEKSMNEALAARGIGSGSGAIASAYGDLYQNQQNNIANLTNQMTQFGLTPYSAPPITMAYPGMPNIPGYAQPSSFGERTADMLSGITGQLGGLYAYNWLKNSM